MTRPSSGRGGALRKFLLVLIAAVALLLIVVGVFGPAIASALAPGYVAGKINRDIRGQVALSGVRLGWGAPIRVESLTIRDPAGREAARARAEIGTGLWRLLTGGLDLGTIRLKADLDLVMDKDGRTNLDEALSLRPGVVPSPKPAPPSGPAPAAPAAPVRLPRGLKFDFELEPSTLKLAGKEPGLIPGAGAGAGAGGAIELTGVIAHAAYSHAGPFQLTLNAQPVVAGRRTEAIALSIASPQLTNPDGSLRRKDAAGELSIVLSLPQVLADAVAARAGLIDASGIDQNPATPGGEDGALDLRAALKLENGRIVLARPSTPPTFSWKLPASIGAALGGGGSGGARVTLAEGPVVSLSIAQLGLPVDGLLGGPGPPGKADWRGASFIATLGVGACAGTVTLGEGASPQPFATEPLLLDVRAADLAQGLRAAGSTKVRLGQAAEGSVAVQAEANGVLDDRGAFRAGLPADVKGFIALERLPTGIFEPLARRAGITLAEAVGPVMDMRLEAKTGGGTGAASSVGGAPPTDLSFSLAAEKLRAAGGVMIAGDRLLATGDGISASSTAAGPLARALVPALKGRLDGDGLAIVQISALEAPLAAGQPDLKHMRLAARVAVGDLRVRVGGADGAEEVIDLTSLETVLAIAPEAPPRVDLDWRLAGRGEKFAAIGSMTLPGLIAWTAPAYPHLAVTPGAVRPAGKIEIIDVPTRLAGLLSARAGELAPATAGPKLGGAVEAAPTPGGGGSALTMRFAGERLDVRGKASLEDQTITIGPDGITAEIRNPAAAANAILRDQGVDFSGTGAATVKVTDTSIALPAAGRAFSLAAARAKLRAEVGALSATIRPTEGGAPAAFSLDSLASDITLDRGAAALDVNAKGAYDGRPMSVEGRMAASLDKVLAEGGRSGGFDLSRLPDLALDGSIRATRVPVAVAAMVAPDKVDLAREFAGETIDLEIGATKGSSITFKANAERLAASGGAAIAGTTLKVQPLDARATVTPGGVAAALRAFAPDWKGPPSLAKPVALALRAPGFDLSIDPKDAAKPIGERLGALSATLKAEGDIVLAGIALDDSPRRVGAIIRGLEGEVLADPRDRSKSRASARAEILNPDDGASGGALARLDAEAGLASAPLSARARITNIDTARMDRWLGREGLLAESLGARADLSATISRPAAGAPMHLAADLDSPAIKTSLKAERSDASTRLLEPASVRWTLAERWANRYVFTPDEGGRRGLTMKGDAPVTIDLKRLAIGPSAAPLRPGVFDLDFAAAVPAIDLTTAEGVPVRFTGIALTARSINDVPGGVQFTLNADQAASGGAGVGSGGGASQLLRATGRIADLADASGAPTAGRARLTLDAKGSIPTPVIDALARSGTLYTAVLGPVTAVDLAAQDLSKNSGALRGSVRSENSSADAAGSVRDGRFTASAPVKARLTRITPEASRQLISSLLPLVENVEKTADDRPAAIDAIDFTAPVDGDMTKLNGVVTVDLGTVRFATSTFLGGLLDLAKVRSKGTAGQRIEPFVVRIDRGVAAYDRFKLPLGEFAIETEGVIDLVKREFPKDKDKETFVYIPFFAVSKELAGIINSDLTARLARLPVLDSLTMIPVQVSGPLDNPKTRFAADKFIQESGRAIIEKGLEKGVKDVLDKGLKDLFEKKKKP